MTSELNIKQLMAARKLAPSKAFGQNFLVHAQTAKRIVESAAIQPDDTIVELGVGFGALTHFIAQQAQHVHGIELDAGIIRYHQEQSTLPSNVTLHHQDLLQADFRELSDRFDRRLKIMANTPYSISNLLLFKLFDNQDIVDWAVLMLQKEVAQRLKAPTGTKEYGVLTALFGTCATIESLIKIGPGQFHPRPKVDSEVIRITFHHPSATAEQRPSHDPKILKTIVNAAFQQRRKTILNALSASPLFNRDKKIIADLLKHLDISPKTRAEQLTSGDYIRMARACSDLKLTI